MYKFNEEFDKFQLEEYKNISQAHFKIIETISTMTGELFFVTHFSPNYFGV